MKKLVLETTAPFQGLPELVADDEGLFEREGLQIEWIERESADKSTDVGVTGPKGLNPFSSHGLMLEQGKADMYNACEWGNYCRVQDTKVGSRQVGRRAHRHLRRDRGAAGFASVHGAATGGQAGRRAVLFRHALSRAASARRLHAARADQALPAPRTARATASTP